MTTTVDCIWNQWHEWEQCSKSCGGGITSRTRNIKQYAQLGGQECVGDAFQTKECNKQDCPSKSLSYLHFQVKLLSRKNYSFAY